MLLKISLFVYPYSKNTFACWSLCTSHAGEGSHTRGVLPPYPVALDEYEIRLGHAVASRMMRICGNVYFNPLFYMGHLGLGNWKSRPKMGQKWKNKWSKQVIFFYYWCVSCASKNRTNGQAQYESYQARSQRDLWFFMNFCLFIKWMIFWKCFAVKGGRGVISCGTVHILRQPKTTILSNYVATSVFALFNSFLDEFSENFQ